VIRSFDSAYAYARVCGSLARSFLGTRAAALAKSPRVGEAWRAIFDEAPLALPEAELATAAELRVRHRANEAMKRIAGDISLEEPFFAALLRKREFAYMKNLLAAVAEGAPEAPPHGAENFLPEVALQTYPDLDAMLRGTRYEWAKESGLADLPSVKNRLDRQYYAELWASVRSLPPRLAGSIPKLLRVEAELENLVWGLRLKRYYSMGAEDIEPLLIELEGIDVTTPTLSAVRLRADARSEWALWKWERLLPDPQREAGGEWYFDLRGFESASQNYLYALLFRRLHLEFDSFVPLYAYFRLKEFETRAIQGIIEGIRLEAPAAEIGAFAVAGTGGAA
jgi:hypothetical protein